LSDRIIYDFGANRGLNLPYYLQKAERVIAVEANRTLAEGLRARFAQEIRTGRLVVVDQAVTTRFRDKDEADFFVYTGDKASGHAWSSLQEPVGHQIASFRRVTVASTDAHQLFMSYGQPFFVKIDLEHHDAIVLTDVLNWPELPAYISVEAHDPEILGLLLLAKRYRSFQLVDGRTVGTAYRSHPTQIGSESRRVDFPPNSAGPFGEDLLGPWLSRTGLVRAFGSVGPGWVDIHASLHHEGVEAVRDPAVETLTVPDGVRAPAAAAVRLSAVALGRLPRAIRRRVSGALKTFAIAR